METVTVQLTLLLFFVVLAGGTICPLETCNCKCCFVEIPNECNKFCFCSFLDFAVEITCPEGRYFDPELAICLDNDEFSCPDILPSGLDCRKLKNGKYVYPGRCDVFVHCSNGYESLLRCPSDLHFSNITGDCEYPHLAECKENVVPTPATTTSTKSGTTTTQSTGRPEPPTAAPTQNTGRPEPPTVAPTPNEEIPVTAATTSSPVTGTQRPTTSGGPCIHDKFYPDERNCSRFYICAHGVLVSFNCPSGLHWCQHCERPSCQYSDKAGCGPKRKPPTFTSIAQVMSFRKLMRKSCHKGQEFDPVTMSCRAPAAYTTMDDKRCADFQAKLW